jgi:hypothetical protein
MPWATSVIPPTPAILVDVAGVVDVIGVIGVAGVAGGGVIGVIGVAGVAGGGVIGVIGVAGVAGVGPKQSQPQSFDKPKIVAAIASALQSHHHDDRLTAPIFRRTIPSSRSPPHGPHLPPHNPIITITASRPPSSAAQSHHHDHRLTVPHRPRRTIPSSR